MSVSYISDFVKWQLWGRAAGRCEYRGCNHPLWLDDVTTSHLNSAYVAHIVADKPGGPRGDPVLSEKLKSDFSNLMLLCDAHHRKIDIAEVANHPVDVLQAMKEEHESRVFRATEVGRLMRSEILLYGANIGEHVRLPSVDEARDAMLPEWYPARDRATILGISNARHEDHEETFWTAQADHLRRAFEADVRPFLRDPNPPHVSVFGLAPQPLLMLLGSLLTDLVPAEVYQRHREPPSWKWLPAETTNDVQDLVVQAPAETNGQPALALALSGTITDERILQVVPNASIWRVTIATPNNDYLKVRAQLREFREKMRGVMDRINSSHGQDARLHVFPAAPVANCIEFGRILMPKADLPVRVYDQSRKRGGFIHALDLNGGQ